MMTLNELKLLGAELIAAGFLSVLLYGIIYQFIMRIENKARKSKRQQITRKTVKFDIYDFVMKDMKFDYIGQKQVYMNELKRM